MANALGDVRLDQKLMPPSVIPFRLLVVQHELSRSNIEHEYSKASKYKIKKLFPLHKSSKELTPHKVK